MKDIVFKLKVKYLSRTIRGINLILERCWSLKGHELGKWFVCSSSGVVRADEWGGQCASVISVEQLWTPHLSWEPAFPPKWEQKDVRLAGCAGLGIGERGGGAGRGELGPTCGLLEGILTQFPPLESACKSLKCTHMDAVGVGFGWWLLLPCGWYLGWVPSLSDMLAECSSLRSDVQLWRQVGDLVQPHP